MFSFPADEKTYYEHTVLVVNSNDLFGCSQTRFLQSVFLMNMGFFCFSSDALPTFNVISWFFHGIFPHYTSMNDERGFL